MELYVHIPYCAKKCSYCDFVSYPCRESTMNAYVDALLREAAVRAEELDNPAIDTVFIGGGTPSLLPANLLEKLLVGLKSTFTVSHQAEFTCEANPGTLTEKWLNTAASNGINRLSMGMQCFQPELLQLLGRIHTYDDVVNSVCMCRNSGISNINIDLMFGIPTQTCPMWEKSLDAALDLNPTHLSCYSLILEDGTSMKALVDSGQLSLPSEEDERWMYDYSISRLAAAGFSQYEISNFAVTGKECRHNIGYWTQVPYIGLGAAACSMLTDCTGKYAYYRENNTNSLDDYIRNPVSSRTERENITFPDAQYEAMMVGLRLTAGVSETCFQDKYGISIRERFGKKLEILCKSGLMEYQDGFWKLSRSGLDLQNYVLTELMD